MANETDTTDIATLATELGDLTSAQQTELSTLLAAQARKTALEELAQAIAAICPEVSELTLNWQYAAADTLPNGVLGPDIRGQVSYLRYEEPWDKQAGYVQAINERVGAISIGLIIQACYDEHPFQEHGEIDIKVTDGSKGTADQLAVKLAPVFHN